jgi:hypothetical protein
LIVQEENREELDGQCVVMTRAKKKQQTGIDNDEPSTAQSSTHIPLEQQRKNVSPLDNSRLLVEQRKDTECQRMLREIETRPSDQFNVIDGIIFRTLKNNRTLPLVPIGLRLEVLRSFHDHPTSGHFGRDRTWH